MVNRRLYSFLPLCLLAVLPLQAQNNNPFGQSRGGFGGNQGNGSFSYLLSCPGLTSGSSYTVTIGTTSSTCKAATSYAGR